MNDASNRSQRGPLESVLVKFKKRIRNFKITSLKLLTLSKIIINAILRPTQNPDRLLGSRKINQESLRKTPPKENPGLPTATVQETQGDNKK